MTMHTFVRSTYMAKGTTYYVLRTTYYVLIIVPYLPFTAEFLTT